MTDELEPSECTACLPWGFSDASDAARKKHCRVCAGTGLVYAIPPIHRVVSVADLYDAINCIAYSGHYGNTDADSVAERLRAIIDNTAKSKGE